MQLVDETFATPSVPSQNTPLGTHYLPCARFHLLPCIDMERRIGSKRNTVIAVRCDGSVGSSGDSNLKIWRFEVVTEIIKPWERQWKSHA